MFPRKASRHQRRHVVGYNLLTHKLCCWVTTCKPSARPLAARFEPLCHHQREMPALYSTHSRQVGQSLCHALFHHHLFLMVTFSFLRHHSDYWIVSSRGVSNQITKRTHRHRIRIILPFRSVSLFTFTIDRIIYLQSPHILHLCHVPRTTFLSSVSKRSCHRFISLTPARNSHDRRMHAVM